MTLEAKLLEKFGFAEFRAGQKELVEAVLQGRDALGVMPTGGGKSLCFQLPAALLEGTAVVISPLIALMKDQVDALRARGIAAEFYNSTLTADERRRVREHLASGRVRLLYMAPERMQAEGFMEALGQASLSFLAIDEAHCISHWGHDFRPDYRRIGQLRQTLRRRDGSPLPCIALTATATQRVQEDILERLGMVKEPDLLNPGPVKVITGFRRVNLAFEVKQVSGRAEKLRLMQLAIAQAKAEGGSAVVYCATRKNVERVAGELKAEYYHAGLDDDERQRVQDAFLKGEARVLVATNAFGMGIDKSDVRLVAHYDIPGSVEAYYQEAGRAGRDGRPARCLLLFNYADVATQQHFIKKDQEESGGPDEEESHSQIQETLLKQIVRYAYANDCRQKMVLEYFGDAEARSFTGCGQCDVCKPGAREELAAVDEWTSLASRQALAAVARMNGRFGKVRVCEVLKGSETAAVLQTGLQNLSTYGLLKEWSAGEIRKLVDLLIDAGYVRVSGLDYPVVSLSQEGLQALKGETAIKLRSPLRGNEGRGETNDKPRRKKGAAGSADTSGDDEIDYDEGVFEKLKSFRAVQARELGVPAYVVFHDRTLKELAARKPSRLEDLESISGFGPKKLEKYGGAVLEVLKEA